MADSYKKLRDLCQAEAPVLYWFTELENTQWLENISNIMQGVISIVELIDKGCSVVTHCSDGWDRTAQLCSLAELLLDPYYRTYAGFEVLIEKEWLGFGHQFQTRYGLGPRLPTEESPIFIQFMDSVFQIIKQFPCSFQFNEAYLITILDHLYSCRFGTFLYNSEKERVENDLKKRTKSLWSSDVKRLQLWTNYYLRWDKKMKEKESLEKKAQQLKEKYEQLMMQMKDMDRQKRKEQ